jgi:hypothetical protein
MTNKLLSLSEDVINNPAQYKYEIIKKLGSVVFYEEGEECPYFKYQTLSCFHENQNPFYTQCYGRTGSGVNNLMEMKDEFDRPNVNQEKKSKYKDTTINYDTLYLNQDGIKILKKSEVIDLISDMYRFSVYPTRTQVYDYITEHFAELTGIVPEKANRIAGRQTAIIQSILNGITKQDFVKPTQEFLCKEFPGVYYNFVCRSTEGTSEIDRYNHSLRKSETIRNTLRYPVENIPLDLPPHILQFLYLYKKANNTRKNKIVNLLKTRISEAELKRKKNIKNFYMNPKYVSNKKEELSKLYNEYAKVDEYYRKSGKEMLPRIHNRYIGRFKNYEFLTTFKPPSNETNSVYVQQNGKWVKQGGTRKRK